jgi:hypothetical protein
MNVADALRRHAPAGIGAVRNPGGAWFVQILPSIGGYGST